MRLIPHLKLIELGCEPPLTERAFHRPSDAPTTMNGQNSEWIMVRRWERRSPKSIRHEQKLPHTSQMTGTKRPRSPPTKQHIHGRCFRSSHWTSECRHLVVCKRYECMGHVVTNCPVKKHPSPHRRRHRNRRKGHRLTVNEEAKMFP